MNSPFRYLSLIILACGLSSCDSVKSKMIAFLDQKIEQTGGESAAGSADGVNPGEAASGPAGGQAQQTIRDITDAEFEEFTKISGHVVVVDFHADWCGPCKRLSPILKAIVEDHGGKVLLGKMDVDTNKQTPAKLGVRGIPDVRIYVNGKQVDKFVGLMPEQALRQRIEPHLAKITNQAPRPRSKPEPEPEPEPKPQPEPEPEPEPQPQPQPQEPEEEPKIRKMDKDWLPPGIQRKGA